MVEPTKTLKIGGITAVNVTAREEQLLRGRDAFVNQYCTEKGWDRNNLVIQQILEIRQQPGWKCPA